MVELSAVSVAKKSDTVGKNYHETLNFNLLPKDINLNYLVLKSIIFTDTDSCK